jgi:outer membrane lipase/esterase
MYTSKITDLCSYDNSWRVSPTIGVQYTNISIDGYSETGAGVLNLTVPDQNIDSLETKAGVEVSKRLVGVVDWLTLSGYGNWHHELMNNNRIVNTSFNSVSLGTVPVATGDPERDYFILGGGIYATPFSNKAVHLTLGYNYQFGQEGVTAHSAFGGYRMDF